MPTTTDLAARLAQIVSLQQEILSTTALGDTPLMNLVADRIAEIASASGGVVELIHGEDFVYRAASGPVRRFLGVHIPIEQSLSGFAIRQKEVISCPDTEADPRVDVDACRDMGIRAMIVAPLLSEEGVLGVLKAYSDRRNHFDDLDVYAVQLVAGIASSALRLSHLFRERELSEQRYRMLFENNVAGVFRTTVDGRILDSNDALAHLLGYPSREALMQRRATELYADVHHRELLLETLQEQEKVTNVRIPMKRLDGSLIKALVTIGFLVGGDEKQLIGTVVADHSA